MVTFCLKDGLTAPRLHEITRDIVCANVDLVFLEITANDISSKTSVVELGDSMLAFAIFLTAMADVRQWSFHRCILETVQPQLFLWTLISMTGCMPIINICTMLAIRLRLFAFGVIKGW